MNFSLILTYVMLQSNIIILFDFLPLISSVFQIPALTSLSPVVSAQELTRIELEYLSYLGPAEFINIFAREKCNKNSEISNDIDLEEEEQISNARVRSANKTEHFDAYVEWFNHLSFVVADSVCTVRVIFFTLFLYSSPKKLFNAYHI